MKRGGVGTRRLHGLAAGLSLAAALAIAPAAAQAQAFPTKPMRIILPYPGGTGPEIIARLFGDKFRQSWGQQVVIEPRPGAAGFLAMEAIRKGSTDGHDLLIADTAQLSINSGLFKKLPYDPERDVMPVGVLAYAPFIVTVGGNSPVNSIRDLIVAAKASPGKLTFGHPGIGTVQHLGGAMFEFATGISELHVPYKDFGQLLTSVAAGDIAWTFSTIGSSRSFVQSKRVKLVAVAVKNRLPALPDVPTVAEAGGPADFEVRSWIAMFAPAGVPAEVIAKINQEVQRNLREQDLRDRLQSLGLEPGGGTPADLAQLARSDTRRWGEVIKRTGASID